MNHNRLDSVRIVFFDLDDTLCGYWDASKAALRQAFDELKPSGISTDEMVEEWAAAFREFSPTLKQTGWYDGYLKRGEPTRTEQMRLTLLRVGVDNPERARELSEAYGAYRTSNLRLFPEVPEVLKVLHGRYPLGLITNGPADIQRDEIAALEIGQFFQFVHIEGEMGRGKPHLDVFNAISAECGFSGEQILFVGNSYAHDVRPAIDAGWHAIWVRRPSDVPPSANGMTAQPEEKPEGAPSPAAIVNDLRDVLNLLGLTVRR